MRGFTVVNAYNKKEVPVVTGRTDESEQLLKANYFTMAWVLISLIKWDKVSLVQDDIMTWKRSLRNWPFARRVWAPSQYPKRRLSVRSRKVSKPRDLYLELSDRSEILQALRQQCCRCACQISKRYDNLKYQSRGFETLRDLTKRRLFGYWDGALPVTGIFQSQKGPTMQGCDVFFYVSLNNLLNKQANCRWFETP